MRAVSKRLGLGLCLVFLLASCGNPAPSLQVQAINRNRGVGIPTPGVTTTYSPEYLAFERSQTEVIRQLEKSHPDYYPKVETFHMVPFLKKRGEYLFLTDLRVKGWGTRIYQIIGLYDARTKTITEVDRTLKKRRPG